MTDLELGPPYSLVRPRSASVLAGLALIAVGAACSGAGGGGGGTSQTITLAAVDNPQMADLKQLVSEFQSKHSDITVKIVTLPEDQLRQRVTQDVAANIGRLHLFTMGSYEVPLWAKKKWIENLSPYVAKDPAYDESDRIPGIKGALSFE